MTNLAIFVSGTGSNCERLIRYFADSTEINVSLVVSSKADAPAVQKAESLGVPVHVVNAAGFRDEEAVMDLMRRYSVDYIILAGFLLMIPSYLVSAYEGRMVNIHPSLLPKFGGKGMYGMNVHRAVKEAGESETGMTVHLVSNVVDGGRVLAQFSVAVSPEDTPEDIAAKEHVLEMEHFPIVIEKLVNGKI